MNVPIQQEESLRPREELAPLPFHGKKRQVLSHASETRRHVLRDFTSMMSAVSGLLLSPGALLQHSLEDQ